MDQHVPIKETASDINVLGTASGTGGQTSGVGPARTGACREIHDLGGAKIHGIDQVRVPGKMIEP